MEFDLNPNSQSMQALAYQINLIDRSLNKNTITQEKMIILYRDSFNDIFYNELNIAPDNITETEVSYESSSVGN